MTPADAPSSGRKEDIPSESSSPAYFSRDSRSRCAALLAVCYIALSGVVQPYASYRASTIAIRSSRSLNHSSSTLARPESGSSSFRQVKSELCTRLKSLHTNTPSKRFIYFTHADGSGFGNGMRGIAGSLWWGLCAGAAPIISPHPFTTFFQDSPECGIHFRKPPAHVRTVKLPSSFSAARGQGVYVWRKGQIPKPTENDARCSNLLDQIFGNLSARDRMIATFGFVSQALSPSFHDKGVNLFHSLFSIRPKTLVTVQIRTFRDTSMKTLAQKHWKEYFVPCLKAILSALKSEQHLQLRDAVFFLSSDNLPWLVDAFNKSFPSLPYVFNAESAKFRHSKGMAAISSPHLDLFLMGESDIVISSGTTYATTALSRRDPLPCFVRTFSASSFKRGAASASCSEVVEDSGRLRCFSMSTFHDAFYSNDTLVA